jgi:hypothetical protein
MQGPHCTQHELASVHDDHATGAHRGAHGASSSAWTSASPHQCPHCPPAECATAQPCASGSSSQAAPSAVTAVVSLPMHGRRVRSAAQWAASVRRAPPTPPPQAAA